MALNIEAVSYKNFRNKFINEPIIEKLNFVLDSGKVSFSTSKNKAVLYSPDLAESVNLKGVKKHFSFELNDIKRYLVIELY